MRKIVLASLAAFALATTVSMAADDVMATRYGNTTVSTDAKGVETKVYYSADHTFTFKSGTQSGKGTWKIDGGNICLTYEVAIPGVPNPLCLPVTAHKVGDTWTTGEGDQKRTVKLVAGVQ
jgi:hypothetical protein